MSGGNDETSGNAQVSTSWRPRIDSFEWYGRWAVDNMAPCECCTPEYRQLYGRLQGTVQAADSCFQIGYQLYSELSTMRRKENHEPDQPDLDAD